MRTLLLTACTLVALVLPVQAGQISSVYSKLDFKKTCKVLKEVEEGGSVSMLCDGYEGYAVHFAEGDLRHSVQFGYVETDGNGIWQSFTQWNRVAETVEWRLQDGTPVAAILRWFIENTDDAGSADPARVGQVLVVSRVGRQADKGACVVGYVDALANRNANVLARQVADSLTQDFVCGTDRAEFHGKRGRLSGDPS
ncbi:hypothetical protein [Anderseniella sp. Alg231-50]|uniref:hypothetical protein n=1 Tax=Anderseniella sp. Alg231-50 TaxID=1922226 RepID=UPI000D55DCFE